MSVAFSTDDPKTVAAFRDAREKERVGGQRIREDAEKLGKNKGALLRRGLWGLPDQIVGLSPDNPQDPPEGWRFVKTRDRLEPRGGKAGRVAREWLDDHQPADVRNVMTEHGLPRNSRSEPELSGRYRLMTPVLFEHDGTLWAKYEGYLGEMEGECTWTPRKLSEFFAAFEAVQDRG